MKKKSSTISKSRIKNNGAPPFFCAVIAVLLLAAALNVWLFVRSLYSATSRDEAPIATVTWKRKVAQRRFLDTLAWDRLGQESYLYNGDTIRTASLAEAEIRFVDGSVINMDENTMTQVFLVDGVASAALGGGNVTVDSSEAEKGMTLRQGSVTVQVDSGSSLIASAGGGEGQDGGLALTLMAGSAVVDDGASSSALDTDSQLVLSGGAAERIESPLSVASPAPGEKILSYSSGAVQVPFRWTLRDSSMRVVLELSRSRNFSSILSRVAIEDAAEASVPIGEGTTYWRFVNADAPQNGEDAALPGASGYVRVFLSSAPELISPAQSQSFSYRAKLPQLNLSWSEAAEASHYLVEVADNPEINNPSIAQQTQLRSMRITAPGTGEWWWRVTPYYAINETGLANPSEARSFTVLQSGALEAPRLQRPAANAFVNSNAESAIFSWYADGEAARYTLRIAKNRSLDNPAVVAETDKNYANVSLSDIADGSWWWGVTLSDAEGNVSPQSESRAFVVINGELVFRQSFPPDGYSIDLGQLADTRFTWESNAPYGTRVQISSDANFSTIVRDVYSQDHSLASLSLGEGSYWWRISADTDAVELDSPARRFTVLAQMPAPTLTAPAENSTAVPRAATPYEFRWTSVGGASYYGVALYNASSQTPVFEQSRVYGTSVQINMDGMAEGSYRWTVQPFADETPRSSMRAGLLASASFQMSRLRPVSLDYPANGARIDGIQAISSPITARWSSVEDARSSVFTLWRVEDGSRSVVLELRNPQNNEAQLPRLRSGDYSWTVNATTADGVNISALGQSSFTVLPVPPFPAPTSLSPEDGRVFGRNYFNSSREIVFSWDAVEGATEYLLEIRTAGGAPQQVRSVSGTRFIVQPADGITVLFSQTVTGTSYTFTAFDKLDRGDFVWSVRAQSVLEDGTLLYDGEAASSRFKLDVPQTSLPRINRTGTLYGE